MVSLGSARLPQSTAAGVAVIIVELEVEPSTNSVLACRTIPQAVLLEKVLNQLLTGTGIDELMSEVIPLIQRRYVGPWRKAVISALANAIEAYNRAREEASES